MTVLDALARSVSEATEFNRNDVVAPRCVLWPDGDRQWEPAVKAIAAALPHVFTLGEVDANLRRGPAAFLRAQLTHENADTAVPLLYLPGIPRTAFRSTADCPEEARHLYALQFEGQFWLQRNGKDWTPYAFLSSEDGGLGLDVGRDNDTLNAIHECLPKILEADVAALRRGKLEAVDFRELVATDPARMLLRWIGQPQTYRQQWTGAEWTNFCAIARERFGFNPEKDGELVAAEKLAAGTGEWREVWSRYADSPRAFPGVDDTLSKVAPPDLFAAAEGYPIINQRREAELRKALVQVGRMPLGEARKRVLELAEKEEPRTNWVWAKLEQARLAQAVAYLRVLVTQQNLFAGGSDWSGIAEGYVKEGWQVDLAALHALASVRDPGDLEAVTAALRGIYIPWLESLAHHAQSNAASYPNPSTNTARQLTPAAGTVFLFVDGLRFDLGQLLAAESRVPEVNVSIGYEWAALPTVTATAKPAWAPLAGRLDGAGGAEDFAPQDRGTGKPLSTARFRDLMGELGITYIPADQAGDPNGCGWSEIGACDRHGHDEGVRLAWRVEEQLRDIKHRVRQLFAVGWKRVLILTDHGWLLAPGGLPKVEFPKHLSVSRWGRCATPHAGAQHRFKEVPWFWDNAHAVVLAPGIGCFKEGIEYTHGGLTLQEALLPRIEITCAAAALLAKPELVTAKWKGLRLSVTLRNAAGLRYDLRTKAADENSSLLASSSRAQSVPDSGEVSLLVERDDLIGSAALLVLIAPDGRAVFKQAFNIGEN